MWFGLSVKVNKIPEYQRNTGMTASRYDTQTCSPHTISESIKIENYVSQNIVYKIN